MAFLHVQVMKPRVFILLPKSSQSFILTLLSANPTKWLNTQTIRGQIADELSVFGQFVKLTLKGLTTRRD